MVSEVPNAGELLNVRGLPGYLLVYLKTETELVSEMYVFKKLGDGQSPQKECQLTSVGFRSLFWIS